MIDNSRKCKIFSGRKYSEWGKSTCDEMRWVNLNINIYNYNLNITYSYIFIKINYWNINNKKSQQPNSPFMEKWGHWCMWFKCNNGKILSWCRFSQSVCPLSMTCLALWCHPHALLSKIPISRVFYFPTFFGERDFFSRTILFFSNFLKKAKRRKKIETSHYT